MHFFFHKSLKVHYIVFAVFILSAIAVSTILNQKKEIPVFGETGDFLFTNADLKQITQRELLGGIYITNFFFTSCPKICPQQMGKLAKILKNYPNLKALSVSVDPDNDTPEKLREYLTKFNGDSKQWLLVKNDIDKVKLFADKLMLGFGGNASLHSTRFVFVDKTGKIRGFVDSEDDDYQEKVKEIVRNIE